MQILRIILFLLSLTIWCSLTSGDLFEKVLQTITNVVSLPIEVAKFTIDSISYSTEEYGDATPVNQEEYDFIVVGAGTAGAIIASRLSEVEKAKILLIEAGGHEELFMDIPLVAPFLKFISDLHWDYSSEPSNDYCRGMNDNRCSFHVGKVMGGSSVTNFLMAVRGNKNNFDYWAKMTNDESWSYTNFLKYLKKLEKTNLTFAMADSAYRNFDGPIKIENSPYRSKLVEAFIKAGQELSLPSVDYNGKVQTGFSYLQSTQENGERISSNRAYLHPIKNKKNLFVSMNSHVEKLLIDSQSMQAYGVEFTKDNKKIQVKASKEVILCAGGIGSAKLLMLSGVGPEEHLQNLSINVLQNSSVGENLMDHVAYGGLTFLVNESVGVVVSELLNPTNPAISDYLSKRQGILTLPAGIEAVGLVNVDDPSAENENPNIELAFASAHLGSSSLIHKVFNINDTSYEKSFNETLNKHGWTVWPILMQPKSRGKILLGSADPTVNAKVYPGYFTDRDDVRVAIKGIRMAIEVSKTAAMQIYNSTLYNATIPGCGNYIYDSDDYWECALRTYTLTIFHYSGTCKMGHENDTSAVVNSKLQVKGIQHLRVADASIMPMIITGHPQIAVMAIAEKASDIIKSYWNYTET